MLLYIKVIKVHTICQIANGMSMMRTILIINNPFRLLALPFGIAFHHQLVLCYHPIFLLPYHFLSLFLELIEPKAPLPMAAEGRYINTWIPCHTIPMWNIWYKQSLFLDLHRRQRYQFMNACGSSWNKHSQVYSSRRLKRASRESEGQRESTLFCSSLRWTTTTTSASHATQWRLEET